ncbi:MAG: ParA family protein [Chloroflexota bacterium]|nr:ParA family protein [Chloroflexota bacterium]
MKVMAVGAQKGGVGKTTTAIYVAAHAVRHLRQPGGRVGLIDRDESGNLTQLLRLRPDLLLPGLELLPGPHVPLPTEAYDFVVIDTPPGVSAISSLAEANLVVVPVLPEPQGVANLIDYLANIDNQGRTVSPNMRLLALLPTMVETRVDIHREHLELIRQIAAAERPPLAVLPHVRRLSQIRKYDLAAPDYATAAKELFSHAYAHEDTVSAIA